jgi:hypothetical protein
MMIYANPFEVQEKGFHMTYCRNLARQFLLMISKYIAAILGSSFVCT